MSAEQSFAQERVIDGEILRITGGRTTFMVDLTGDLDLEAGAAVSLTVDGKQRTGTVKKVTDNGNALIRLNKGLPKSVKVGDSVSMVVDKSAADAGESTKVGAVKLTKGGFKKQYWDEVSFIAAHRRAGIRSDVEVSYLVGQGAEDTNGGSANEETELAVDDKSTGVGVASGWVGRDGFGGGLMLDYVAMQRTASADVTTADLGQTGEDEFKTTRTVVDLTPYLAYLSRPKTGDFGYGIGLGVPVRNTNAERLVTINSTKGEAAPAKTSEMGVAVELLAGNNSWAALIGITPLSGKITQSGTESVDRSSAELSVHLELYGKSQSARAGFTYLTTDDKYPKGALKESGVKVSGRIDFGMGSLNIVPFVDYISTKREQGSLTGKFSETDFGARLAFSGPTAPFVALGLNLKNGEETVGDGAKVDSKTSGIRFAGGVNI